GSVVPWVRRGDGPRALYATAGPDLLRLTSDVETRGVDLRTEAEFEVAEGRRVRFGLSWFPSRQEPTPPIDLDRALEETEAWWAEWAGSCEYKGPYREAV